MNAGALPSTARAVVTAAALLAVVPAAAPLGVLGGTLTLVVVLPPLAVALDRLGWSDAVALRLGRFGGRVTGTVAAFAAWVILSSLLTLDVAAVVAAPVGLSIARMRGGGQRGHVGAAILGANAGSLLFPFSNLTNLLLFSAAGLGFSGYVSNALWPQLAAAGAIGALLAFRLRAQLRRGSSSADAEPDDLARPDLARPGEAPAMSRRALLAGGVAAAGALAAVAVGIAGADVAVVFAIAAACVAALAVSDGAVSPEALARSVPLIGVVVVLGAAAGIAAIGASGVVIPHPEATLPDPLRYVALAAVGGGLSLLVNNLPAAALGAIWLGASSAPAVVAYLIGTNIVAIGTPHGSLATVLARSLAADAGHPVPRSDYLRGAWRYALLGAAAALVALWIAAPR